MIFKSHQAYSKAEWEGMAVKLGSVQWSDKKNKTLGVIMPNILLLNGVWDGFHTHTPLLTFNLWAKFTLRYTLKRYFPQLRWLRDLVPPSYHNTDTQTWISERLNRLGYQVGRSQVDDLRLSLVGLHDPTQWRFQVPAQAAGKNETSYSTNSKMCTYSFLAVKI